MARLKKRRIMDTGLAGLDPDSISGKLPVATSGRHWCVVAVNNKTGQGTVMNRMAMTLEEAESNLSRFSENAHRRVQLWTIQGD